MKKRPDIGIHRAGHTPPAPTIKPPIHVGALSNGEVFRPTTARDERVIGLILEQAERGARRHGIDRREFLASSMGMATSLWAMNLASGCSGSSPRARGQSDDGPLSGMNERDGGDPFDGGSHDGSAGPFADGGSYQVPGDASDPEEVCEVMLDASKEFIFDIQTHHVHRANALYTDFLEGQKQYAQYCSPNRVAALECFGRNEWARLMFLESDTTVAVLSGLPAVDDANNPITNAEIAESRDFVNSLAQGTKRVINHHMVLPNQAGSSRDSVQRQLDAMARTKDVYGSVGAWKCYPAWAPENTELLATGGFFLDDEATGIPFLTKGIELGVGTFCIHKGLPIPGFSTKYNDPVDVGRVARRFPQAKFIIYHSAFGHGSYNEGPYTQGSRIGVNSLITSLIENDVAPNANVYAELGTTWQLLSTNTTGGGLTATAHVLGKLFKYVGENNVVWGTDSIWYGSPQSQIESFLQFQISAEFRAIHGYPELTMELKRKVLGLNAARAYGIDPVATRCGIAESELATLKLELDHGLGGRRWSFHEPKLRTRRDFFAQLRAKNLRPG